jgi:plastocyanin
VRRSLYALLMLPVLALAQGDTGHGGHHDHDLTVDVTGVVMNQNRDTLPRGCDAISVDHEFTIRAGREYANDTPGMIFGMSEHEIRVEPCSRVTVNFVNEDEVRHQWMVHGLPKYLYPAGMFHIEAMGGHSKTGTFIVPGEEKNYLIHCDMAQHMEKGMRGQIVVGRGSGNLWGVRDVSDSFLRASYLPGNARSLIIAAILAGFVGAFILGLRS